MRINSQIPRLRSNNKIIVKDKIRKTNFINKNTVRTSQRSIE